MCAVYICWVKLLQDSLLYNLVFLDSFTVFFPFVVMFLLHFYLRISKSLSKYSKEFLQLPISI